MRDTGMWLIAVAAESRSSEMASHSYWSELETLENTLLEFEPMSLIVPINITRMTASITAYSAIS
jgi:hypothetical protein